MKNSSTLDDYKFTLELFMLRLLRLGYKRSFIIRNLPDIEFFKGVLKEKGGVGIRGLVFLILLLSFNLNCHRGSGYWAMDTLPDSPTLKCLLPL